jgi:hypothetical protein
VGEYHRHYDQFSWGWEAIDSFWEVQMDLFDFCVGSHHGMPAPEINRERSIRVQVVGLCAGGGMEWLGLRCNVYAATFTKNLRLS